ncbi:hypothetical protein ACN47E_008034 [Coniothyrium glycines]
MAPVAAELATLRALSFRISSTPTAQLPQHVPAIAACLANCKTLLSTPQASNVKASSSEASVAVHKYRTLITTLLQDRTPQGRWSAIVLVKASIEAGGWETLQKCLPWVRGLLGFLSKPDAPSTKKLCIITLTRIFTLTKEFPTLVREITTPSLPAFLQVCLQIANPRTPAHLLQAILESFNELLPRHPTIFRSYLKQILPLLILLIAPTPSSKTRLEGDAAIRTGSDSQVVCAARRLYTQLHCCAPKGASSEDWARSFKATINDAHRVADQVFRAVHEDWHTSTREEQGSNDQTLSDEVRDLESGDSKLPSWSGIFAGVERLIGLIRILGVFLQSPTASPVYLNIGMLMDLTFRILSLTVPALGVKAFQTAVRLNNQVGKEERENLWLVLPDVHVAAAELLLVLTHRSGSSTTSLDPLIVDQLLWVFGAEKDLSAVRSAVYEVLTAVLERSGKALPKSTIDALVPLMRTCCDDLLPSDGNAAVTQSLGQAKANGNNQPQASMNADDILKPSKGISNTTHGTTKVTRAAHNLLVAILTNVRAHFFSDALRARLDRTAILTQHKDAMLASVLNPPPSKKFGKPAASILPLIARSFPDDRLLEGLLRPRMPVIRLGNQDVEVDKEVDEEEEEEEEEEEVEVEVHDEEEEDAITQHPDDHFVGQELDNMLETAGQPQQAAYDEATMAETAVTRQSLSHVGPPQPTAFMDQTQNADAVKRSLDVSASLSPSKRAKTDYDTQPTVIRESAPTVQTRSSSRLAAVMVPDVPAATSEFAASSTASVVPELPVPGEATTVDIDSDDDDDVIPLVFGQDTDEESD